VCDARLLSRRNYFLATDERGQISAVQCLPGYCLEAQQFCPTSNSTSLIQNCCGLNRKPAENNPFCADCEEGFTEWNGACISTWQKVEALRSILLRLAETYVCVSACVVRRAECDEPDWALLFLLFLASWVYVLGFHWVSQAVNPDSRIFLNFGMHSSPFSLSSAVCFPVPNLFSLAVCCCAAVSVQCKCV
jgi:hypothetical protein